MRPTIDDDDRDIIKHRVEMFNSDPNPRIGDFIVIHGKERRIAHIWHDGSIQPDCGSGSYHMGNHCVSMSGSLDPSIPRESIRETTLVKMGLFWIFHHDIACADNAVYFETRVRVYSVRVYRVVK